MRNSIESAHESLLCTSQLVLRNRMPIFWPKPTRSTQKLILLIYNCSSAYNNFNKDVIPDSHSFSDLLDYFRLIEICWIECTILWSRLFSRPVSVARSHFWELIFFILRGLDCIKVLENFRNSKILFCKKLYKER